MYVLYVYMQACMCACVHVYNDKEETIGIILLPCFPVESFILLLALQVIASAGSLLRTSEAILKNRESEREEREKEKEMEREK